MIKRSHSAANGAMMEDPTYLFYVDDVIDLTKSGGGIVFVGAPSQKLKILIPAHAEMMLDDKVIGRVQLSCMRQSKNSQRELKSLVTYDKFNVKSLPERQCVLACKLLKAPPKRLPPKKG